MVVEPPRAVPPAAPTPAPLTPAPAAPALGPGLAALPAPYFHTDSGALHFWVRVADGPPIGATVSKETLHYRFRGALDGSDVLATHAAQQAVLDAAVLRRVAGGSREPVMLRESDLPTPQRT